MTFPWGRRWFPLVWYLEGCVVGGALWALSRGGRPRDALAAAAYLALCGAAAVLPGALLMMLASAARLGTRTRSLLLHLELALAAGAVAALVGTARGWAAAVTILLTGNAIWAIEIEARRTARAPEGLPQESRPQESRPTKGQPTGRQPTDRQPAEGRPSAGK